MSSFSDYLNTLKKHISYAEDETFSWDDVISLLIIQVNNTDSLNKQREESNATQIQLTSEKIKSEGNRKTEDFFPTLTLNNTFKSWRISIPTRICSDNILVLDGKQPTDNHVWLNDSVQIRRRLLNSDDSGNGNPALQMCYSDDLMPIRKLLFVDDYLVVAKRKNATIYEAFGVKKDVDLGNGKQMYVSEKAHNDESAFDLDNLMKNASKEKITAEVEMDPIPEDLSIEELGKILSKMYNGSDSNAVRVFGLKYGRIIDSNNYSCAAIVRAAGLKSKKGQDSPYSSEVSKGVQLYKSILNNEHGIRFASDKTVSKHVELGYISGLKIDSEFKHNLIVFGAPGTGKSHKVNETREKMKTSFKNMYFERVTFHPDYYYANFVGTYKPVMTEKTKTTFQDTEVDTALAILNDNDNNSQDKYDALVERFNDDHDNGKLAVLVSLYSDDTFKAKSKDKDSEGLFSNEKGYGKALRKYVNLKTQDNENEEISYEYVPGPFMRVLAEALDSIRQGNPKPCVLIIEEINRANVAAVFGDVFQLLDRDKDTNISEYPIQASEDMKKYLAKKFNCSVKECSEIKIPDNMFIWATMNSADQGVFPMDTAFKRRWDFEYLGIDNDEEKIKDYSFKINETTYNWNRLRKAINDVLSENNINEDKLLGPFFLSSKVFEKDNKDRVDTICSKVLMYLFEDAAKQKKDKVFSGKGPYKYSEISSEFKKNGLEVFTEEIKYIYNEKYKAINDEKPEKQVEGTEEIDDNEGS